MFLTKEILESKNACALGIKWLEHYFPNGGEVIEIMSHKRVPIDFLHWGCSNLLAEVSNEDKEFFKEKLNIHCDNLCTISYSQNIINSDNVYHSKNVENSKYIFTSQKITNSNIIHSSRNVESSQQIFNSKDISNCTKIYISNNIANSNNIIQSSNVSNSSGIAFGNNIIDAICVIGKENSMSNNIYSSYFIINSSNLTNCLFCCNKDSENLLIFNHPVSESEFNKYKNELLQIMQNWTPNFISNWGQASKCLDFPLINNEIEFFKTLPQEFIVWAQSLPYYNEDLFLQICNGKKS